MVIIGVDYEASKAGLSSVISGAPAAAWRRRDSDRVVLAHHVDDVLDGLRQQILLSEQALE